MTRIDKYILSQFLGLFGFFGLVLVSVYWINRAVSLFEQLIQDGQTALVVLEFTALTLPLVISVVLPVAAFAATAYGTNRLASESELTAMQAAGLSPWRLARPVLVFGLLVGLMVAVLAHALVPLARARLAERQAEVAENVSARFLKPGAFQYPADGVTLFIGDIAEDFHGERQAGIDTPAQGFAAFLGIELYEFAHLIHEGATPQRSGFLSAFFILVGTHGLHVTFGLVWLVTLMVQVSMKGLIPANQRRLQCLSLFWHFLDIVWICVFTVVYLMGVL